MAITYRSVKGSNLTATEVDANFSDLDTRVTALEDTPSPGNGIANITQSGSQLTIFMDDATEYSVTLPSTAFNWRGEWTAATAYFENDIVSVTGQGIFLVLIDHTSESTFSILSGDTSGDYYQQQYADMDSVYDLPCQIEGAPGNSEIVYRHVFLRDVSVAYFATALHVAIAEVAATAETVFTLKKNGTTFGTITFPAAGTTGVFAQTGGGTTDFVREDILTITNQATADATLADIGITLEATRTS